MSSSADPGHQPASKRQWAHALTAAESALNEKNYTEAFKHYQAAIHHAPDTVRRSEAQYRSGILYYRMPVTTRATLPKELRPGPATKQWYRAIAEGDQTYAQSAYQLAPNYHQAGLRYATDDIQKAITHHKLGHSYENLHDNEKARTHLEEAIAIRTRIYGQVSMPVAESMYILGWSYISRFEYTNAGETFRNLEDIYKRVLGPKHVRLSEAANALGFIALHQWQLAAAEAFFVRALELRETGYGTAHPKVANTLMNLAEVYAAQARYEEAEPVLEKALHIQETFFDRNHARVAHVLHKLANLYALDGDYRADLYTQAQNIFEESYGTNHAFVADILTDQVMLFYRMTRHAKGYELTLSPDKSYSLRPTSFPGSGDPESMLLRALAIRKSLGHRDRAPMAHSLRALAEYYSYVNRHAQAELLHQQALEILQDTYGSGHPSVAFSFGSLAEIYYHEGRYAKAKTFYKRALEIVNGSDANDQFVAAYLLRLAFIADKQAQTSKAKRLYRKALNVYHRLFESTGFLSPEVIGLAEKLVALYETEELLPILGKTVDLMIEHSPVGVHHSTGVHREILKLYLAQLAHAMETSPTRHHRYAQQSFKTGQLLHRPHAVAVVSRIAARFASRNDRLAAEVRRLQDAEKQLAVLRRYLYQDFDWTDEREFDGRRQARREATELRTTIAAVEKRLRVKYPAYVELTHPPPLAVDETKSLLDAGEALVTYLVLDEASYAWVVSSGSEAAQGNVKMYRIAMVRDDLVRQVAALREDLEQADVTTLTAIKPFDTDRAHTLYTIWFAPLESALTGVKTVHVVPDSALNSLPLGVLVRQPVEREIKHAPQFRYYRSVDWLAKHYAFITLPAASALRALRGSTKPSQAAHSFIGFGDPALQTMAEVFAAKERGKAYKHIKKQQYLDEPVSTALLNQLGDLPQTEAQLEAMQRALDGRPEDLYTREAATEIQVKRTNLETFKVIGFATHGLLGNGLHEPGLVLTPPQQHTTVDDDGLLTAGEITQLELDADWVVLSACNTAAPDGDLEAAGLSSLAMAFTYAGSRSLLVSHWSVEIGAGTALIENLFYILKDINASRAEALQGAMLSLLQQGLAGKSYYAHPMFWAPFSVIGDGGPLTNR